MHVRKEGLKQKNIDYTSLILFVFDSLQTSSVATRDPYTESLRSVGALVGGAPLAVSRAFPHGAARVQVAVHHVRSSRRSRQAGFVGKMGLYLLHLVTSGFLLLLCDALANY